MRKNTGERGSALMLVVIIVLILVGISFAYTSLSWWNSRRAFQDEASAQALYSAESAAAIYINELNALDSRPAPKAFTKMGGDGNGYWVPTENLVDFGQASVVGTTNLDPDYSAFQVAAKHNKVTRRINVLITGKAGGVFWNAIFAGNSSKDSSYSLNLAGNTGNGDRVQGNIYTGGNFNGSSNANVYDMDGNASGAIVTYGGTTAVDNMSTSPTLKKGTEPDLTIPRTYGSGSNQLEAEAMAQKYFGTTDRMDPDTKIKWVDVGGEINKNGTANHKWVDGTFATDIVDVNNPAHIFRKNPSSQAGSTVNRTERYEYTAPSAKNDYYLEDPTSTQVTQTMLDGGKHPVNGDTTASMINIKENGNNAVYFIDGNMRVSGEPVKSYQLNPDSSIQNLKMTIVVKGNVSLTDNMLYPKWMSESDSVAIIAVKDDAFPNTVPLDFANGSALLPSAYTNKTGKSTVKSFVDDYNIRAQKGQDNGLIMPKIDISTAEGQAKASQEYNKIYGSGNVFFGDPGSGTVEHFESFMYAENNFYATNLDTTTASGGTKKMEIYGNMTAGNQVSINRSSQATGWVPLSVTFDKAIMNGGGPPGLPQTPGVAGQDWHIVSWKQTANTAETGVNAAKLEK